VRFQTGLACSTSTPSQRPRRCRNRLRLSFFRDDIYSAPSTAIAFVTTNELTASHRHKLLPTVLYHETHLPIRMHLLYVFFSPGEGGYGGLNNLHTASLFAVAAICGFCLQGETHIAEEQLCVVAKRPALGRPMRNSDLNLQCLATTTRQRGGGHCTCETCRRLCRYGLTLYSV